MKNALKSLVSKTGFKKSSLYYHIQKQRQYKDCGINYNLTTHKDVLKNIDEHGIHVQPNYITTSQCQQIIRELQPAIEALINDNTPFGKHDFKHQDEEKLNGLKYSKIKHGGYRIGGIDQITKTAKELFFESAYIREIANASVSPKARSYRREVDYKYEKGHKGNVLQADVPHFDDWRYRWKAFLYLNDIGPEQAPFVYYKGSHKQGKWRTKYNIEYERDGQLGRYGHFFHQEMRDLIQKQGFEELVCTAKAGTLILADFRGIHKGTTLQSGERFLLNNTFGI